VEFEKKKDLLVALGACYDGEHSRKHKIGLQVGYDGEDRWYLEALGIAAEGDEAKLWDALTGGRQIDPLAMDHGLADIAWRLHVPATVSMFEARAVSVSVAPEQRKKAIVALAFTKDKMAAAAMSKIANEGPEDLRDYANWWGHHRMKNDWREWDVTALFPRPAPVLASKKSGKRKNLIKVKGKKVFGSKVARKNARVEIDADITGAGQVFLVVHNSGDGINSDWGNWIEPRFVDAEGKETKVTELAWSAAGSEWGEVQVNKSAGGGKMSVGGKSVAYGIGCHANGTVRYDIAGRGFVRLVAQGGLQTEKNVGSVRFEVYAVNAKKSSGGLDVASILKLKGDPAHGKQLFAGRATCFTCHTHGDIGRNVGPDMAGIGQKFGKDVILDNILNPSAAVAFGYETVVIKTKAGATLNGFLIADADPLVLKDVAGGQHSIAKKDVASREQLKISIMPPASALGLTAQDLADLVAFLGESL
jgi:putative heme-binding domain-containing protein